MSATNAALFHMPHGNSMFNCAAEDTRKTTSLLRHHKVPLAQKQLISFHSHNWQQRMPLVMAALTAGHTTALVTDAGMPGINDPGQELVAAAAAAGVATTCLPGPSCYTTAVALSGLPAAAQGGWLAGGWVPRPGTAARAAWLGSVCDLQATDRCDPSRPGVLVFLEAPSRIARTLVELQAACEAAHVDRMVVVCRELTKRHEEVTRGTTARVAAAVASGHAHSDKGEFTIVLGPLYATDAAHVR